MPVQISPVCLLQMQNVHYLRSESQYSMENAPTQYMHHYSLSDSNTNDHICVIATVVPWDNGSALELLDSNT